MRLPLHLDAFHRRDEIVVDRLGQSESARPRRQMVFLRIEDGLLFQVDEIVDLLVEAAERQQPESPRIKRGDRIVVDGGSRSEGRPAPIDSPGTLADAFGGRILLEVGSR